MGQILVLVGLYRVRLPLLVLPLTGSPAQETPLVLSHSHKSWPEDGWLSRSCNGLGIKQDDAMEGLAFILMADPNSHMRTAQSLSLDSLARKLMLGS